MRGLLAPLSSNEEVTLGRVALEATRVAQLPTKHMVQAVEEAALKAVQFGFE